MEQSRKLTERFKAENPQLARQIEKKLQPAQEAQANSYMNKLSQYQQGLKQNTLSAEDKTTFAKLTKEITQEKQVMNHIKQRDPELAKQIEQIARDIKPLEHSKGLSRGL